jgi:hypothetical protein
MSLVACRTAMDGLEVSSEASSSKTMSFLSMNFLTWSRIGKRRLRVRCRFDKGRSPHSHSASLLIEDAEADVKVVAFASTLSTFTLLLLLLLLLPPLTLVRLVSSFAVVEVDSSTADTPRFLPVILSLLPSPAPGKSVWLL